MELRSTFNQRRVIPAEESINRIAEDFKMDSIEFLHGTQKDIKTAEEYFSGRISRMCTDLLAMLYVEEKVYTRGLLRRG